MYMKSLLLMAHVIHQGRGQDFLLGGADSHGSSGGGGGELKGSALPTHGSRENFVNFLGKLWVLRRIEHSNHYRP